MDLQGTSNGRRKVPDIALLSDRIFLTRLENVEEHFGEKIGFVLFYFIYLFITNFWLLFQYF